MTPDVASSEADDAEDESATIEDVDHTHPESGDTFDRTGVHARGQKHPEDQPDTTETNSDDSNDA